MKQKESPFRLTVIMNEQIAGYQVPNRYFLCDCGLEKCKMSPIGSQKLKFQNVVYIVKDKGWQIHPNNLIIYVYVT